MQKNGVNSKNAPGSVAGFGPFHGSKSIFKAPSGRFFKMQYKKPLPAVKQAGRRMRLSILALRFLLQKGALPPWNFGAEKRNTRLAFSSSQVVVYEPIYLM